MPAVSNTSPLLNLAIIGEVDLLRAQFGELWIPPAVLDELRLDSELPGVQALREVFDAGWVHIAPVNNQPFVQVLRQDLDAGEAEAIVLATELPLSHILLDERQGRRVAHALELTVTGILGVLLRARLAGELASLRDAITALRDEAGFWIAPALEAEILRAGGEV